MAQSKTHLDIEAKLIARAIEGDVNACGILYDRYLNQVYNYSYYRIGNKAETEKVTEKIFITLFERLDRFQHEGKGKHFLAWVFKIANQEIKKHLRGHQNALRNQDDLLDTQQVAILRALKNLGDQNYQIIVSRFFNGLSYSETARIIGVSESKIGELQVKALEELDKYLKKDGRNG